MNNHWLNEAKYKKMFKEIDEAAMEAWGEDGTLADLINSLDDEQTALLMGMKIKDVAADLDDYEFGLTLIKP
jgi:hypothetical protein